MGSHIHPVVTATEVVRHFTEYCREASVAPVVITHHGRAAWALVSAQRYLEINKGDDPDRQRARFDIVVDSMPDILILVDEDGRITRLNASARRYFSVSEAQEAGQTVSALLQTPNSQLLQSALERVLSTGISEERRVDSARYPGRVLHCEIIPIPGGGAIRLRDITDTLRRLRTEDELGAICGALNLSGVAYGAINLRGYIERGSLALSVMTGAAEDRLVGTRLSSLFAASNRVEITDMIERALAAAAPVSADVQLLNRDGDSAVRIALAPLRDPTDAIAAIFTIRD